MKNTHENEYPEELKVDCIKCFGLCCVALYFSATEGFPTDKTAGKPCINLQDNFTCSVHKDLIKKGYKGCTAYDCFGAGQKVSQITYDGCDWRLNPEIANQMFEVFLIIRQLHEMRWYLIQALALQTDSVIKTKIISLIKENKGLTLSDADSLLTLDVAEHRGRVNILLHTTSELIRTKARSKSKNSRSPRLDYFGADLRKADLKGADLRGACLIAANLSGVNLSGADLIGSDLRDANLRGADLSNSIFLTQAQINSAKGDRNTKLPPMLSRPSPWTGR